MTLNSTMDPSHRAPFSDGLMNFSQLIQFVALVVPPSPFRRLLFLPILVNNIYLILYTTTGNPARDNIVGSVLATYLLTASDYILLTDVQRELRRHGERRPISANHEKSIQDGDAPMKPSITQRMLWGLQLMTNVRGIGWAHEPSKSLRSKTSQSRWAFVRGRFFITLVYIAFYDVAGIYRHWLDHEGLLFGRLGLLRRASFLLAFLVTSVTYVCIPYFFLSVVAVAIGITQPADWPHMFGYWSNAWSLRNFWGKVWHQMIRRSLTAHTRWISSNLLGIRRGSTLSSYVQLLLAWTISGVVHGAGEFMAYHKFPVHSVTFFLTQGVGIAIESLVMSLFSHFAPGIQITLSLKLSEKMRVDVDLWKSLGYMWVWCWLLWSLDQGVAREMLDHGMHFSVIKSVWKF